MKITTLQIKTTTNYKKNLTNLIKKYKKCEDSNLVVAPEVCLTGFDYENFKEAEDFSKVIEKELLNVVGKIPLILTLIEKRDNKIYNIAKVFHKNKIIYEQSKYKLFLLGDEDKYFTAGKKEFIEKFEINNIKYGILICFELRFVELWKQLEGVDIIVLPSAWGKPRKLHLEKLANALAIANRCFVVVSNLSNDDMASSSSIISPMGEFYKDDRKSVISKVIDLNEIKKMKRYIPYENLNL